MATTATQFDYRDVVADLSRRIDELTTARNALQHMLIADGAVKESVAPLAAPKSAMVEVVWPDAPKRAVSIKRKRANKHLAPAILDALSHGPLSPSDLKRTVSQQSGGDNHKVDRLCYALKMRGDIEKGKDGCWRLTASERVSSRRAPVIETNIPATELPKQTKRSSSERNPDGPVVRLQSVADLVRQVARESTQRTTIGIIDRVQELAQFRLKRETVSTTISQFLSAGQLIRKGADAAGAPYIRSKEESTSEAIA